VVSYVRLVAAFQEQADNQCEPTNAHSNDISNLRYIEGWIAVSLAPFALLLLWRGKKSSNLLKYVCGPKCPDNKENVAKDSARVQYSVAIRSRRHLFGIL
jgi:hypothetical protein